MKFIPFATYDGQKNMDIDAELLDSAIEEGLTEPIFRLYAWKPACVSLGRMLERTEMTPFPPSDMMGTIWSSFPE